MDQVANKHIIPRHIVLNNNKDKLKHAIGANFCPGVETTYWQTQCGTTGLTIYIRTPAPVGMDEAYGEPGSANLKRSTSSSADYDRLKHYYHT